MLSGSAGSGGAAGAGRREAKACRGSGGASERGVQRGGPPPGKPAVLNELERRNVRGGRGGRGGGHLGGWPVEGEVQQGNLALHEGAARCCRSMAGGGTHLHDTHSCSQIRGFCSRRALGLNCFCCLLTQLYLLLHAAVRSGSGGDVGGECCGALGEPHSRGRLAILILVSYIFSYFCSY